MVNRNKLNEAVKLLNSQSSEAFVNELELTISDALAKAKGEKLAKIESSVPMNPEEKQKVDNILMNIFKNKINSYYETKPALLGGFKITVGDWKLDASILNQLNLLKTNLGGNY